MTELPPPMILAADGGGTRCRLVLCGPGLRHEVEVGAANVFSDFDGAVTEVTRGLAHLAGAAGMSDLTAVPAYFGVAGAISREIGERFAAALPLQHVRVEDDRPAALRGALGDRDGVVVHCGTGSFLAARIDGQMRLAGGWGWLLGDEASAYWLGRAALRRALAAVDGLAEHTGFVVSLLERFQGPAGIVGWAAEARPAEIAGLARDVTRFAEDGDLGARALMQLGANLVQREARAIGWRAGVPLCLTGGLGPQYAPFLPQEMRDALQVAAGDPIEGALALAEAFAGEVS